MKHLMCLSYFLCSFPVCCLAQAEATLGTMAVSQKTVHGNKHVEITIPVSSEKGLPQAAEVQVSCLFDYGLPQESADYAVTTKTKVKGYEVAKGQTTVSGLQKPGSRIANIRVTQADPIPALIDQLTYGSKTRDKQSIAGYHIVLLVGGKEVDSRHWENETTVNRLKKDWELPDAWWQAARSP